MKEKKVEVGIFEISLAAIASAIASGGYGELRDRWLKKEVDKTTEKHERLKEKVSEEYMSKEDTMSMYALMNQANEVKIDNLNGRMKAIEEKIDGVDGKLDQILMLRNG